MKHDDVRDLAAAIVSAIDALPSGDEAQHWRDWAVALGDELGGVDLSTMDAVQIRWCILEAIRCLPTRSHNILCDRLAGVRKAYR